MSARKAAISYAVVSVFAFSSAVSAAPKRKRRGGNETVGQLLERIESNTKRVHFTKHRNALPRFHIEKAKRPRPQNLSAISPPSFSKQHYDYANQDEARLEKITDLEIKQLYKLTLEFRHSKQRGEIWLRLAERYVDKSKLIEYRLQSDYDRKMSLYQAGKLRSKPVLNLSASQAYNRKAVTLYEWFLRDYPHHPKVPQALFFLGYNYFEMNQETKGKEYYKRLTSEFPHSKYVDESNFALAEYYFDNSMWLKAMQRYELVYKHPRTRLYSFALYKASWSEYKLGHVKEALKLLEFVIHAGRVAKGANDRSTTGTSRIRMASEALKDLVVFYAEAGTAEGAKAYFQRIAGPRSTFPLMEKLAYYYVDTGNRTGARYLFHELIRERPMAPKAYDYQYQIVSMYLSTERSDVFQHELYNWIHDYSPGSAWAEANAKDQDLVNKSAQLIETTLRNHILQLHQTAQNSRVHSAQVAAQKGYELYFQTFHTGPNLGEMHFFYAELLYDMKEYPTAAVHYGWVVDHDPHSKYYQRATLDTVLALEKGLPTEAQLKKQVGKSLQERPFEPNVQAFETASLRYIKMFPKGSNVPAIRYKLGVLYYYHNQFDKALASFNEIIKNYPKSEFAKYAANLTLDIYNLKNDYSGLEKAGKEILTNSDLAKSPVGAQIKGVLLRADFKRAQSLEGTKDFGGAADSYAAFVQKNPGTDLAVSAAFNAGVDYEKANEPLKALGMYGMVLRSRQKGHEGLKRSAMSFLARLYELTGQYRRAAEEYEVYANKYPKDKETTTFYYNAALIRDGMNAYKAALQDYQKYFDRTHSMDRWTAVYLMAKLWERRGSVQHALEYYREYYNARPLHHDTLIKAAFKVAQFETSQKHFSTADKWYRKTIYQQHKYSTSKNPIGVSEAAQSKYVEVSQTYTQFQAIHLPKNQAHLKNALNRKLAVLTQLKNQLKSVIQYNDGEMIVRSLVLLGRADEHMAAALLAAPTPKGLNADELKQYKAGVQKYAQPFQDEAVKNFTLAIKRGFDLESFTDGIKTAQRELSRLNKDKYPDYGERGVLTKLPDTMDVESDDTLGAAFKSKDENLLVAAVAKALGKDSNDGKALNALSVHYFNRGQIGLALILNTRALAAHPNQPALYNNLGVISLAQKHQDVAIANFRKALNLKSDYPIAASNLGSIFVEYKDYQPALEYLKEGYSAVESDLRPGVGLGVANDYALALSGTGQLDDAKDVFKNILKVDGQNVTALLNYSILLIDRMKDKKNGEKVLNRLRFLATDSATQNRVNQLSRALDGN